MNPRIAIIGGGITGVAAAYELTRRGHRNFVLYEASNRLGGIVETHRQDGFVVECGADSWITEKPWARELAVELGLEADLIPSNDADRRTYLLEGEVLTPMPDGMRMMVPGDLEAIESSPLFSETAKKAYREEPARAEELKAFASTLPPDYDESIASLVERHFGEEVAEKIAGPLLSGVFGGDIRTLSASAVMAPFRQMEREHGSLILALQQKQRRTAGGQSVFTSLKSGLQTLIERMAVTFPPAAIRLAQPAIVIAQKSGKWEVATAAGSSQFDQVVIATPAHITRELVAPLHKELSDLLDLSSTSAVVAAMGFAREQSVKLQIPKGFGFLVPRQIESECQAFEPQLLATTFVNQKFSYRVPEGCVLLRAFFGGDAAPLLSAKSDESIMELAHRHLSKVLGELPLPTVSLVRRWPRSLPQYAVGHRHRIARVEQIVGNIPGLHLAGNAFYGVGLPDLVQQGRSLASRLLIS
jgi:oxygen-dependent protoporphyrinogen oxidase